MARPALTISIEHPECRPPGMPVILDDMGEVMPHAGGVKAIRALLGFSQSELAERLGISPRTVQAIEGGRRSAAAENLNALGLLLRRKAEADA